MKNRLQKIVALFLLIITPLLIFTEYSRIKSARNSLSFKEVQLIPEEVCESNKSFVVVIVPTAKNEQYWERNLNSIFNQQYKQYRVVYLDDGSSDRLFERVNRYVETHDHQHRVTILPPEAHRSLFERYCNVIKGCRDDEVIVHFDGNDWFAHDKVLEKLNEAYSQKGVWLAYGQYLEYPSYKKSSDQQMNKRLYTDRRFQRIPWMTSPLKTYYAKLFKELNLEEIYHDDSMLSSAALWNFMLPMVKMAKCHIHYIPEVLYVHNMNAQ